MQRRSIKFIIQASIAIIFVVIIVVYSYSKSTNLIKGPNIAVQSPTNGKVIVTPTTDIHGTATNINSISLNDSPILIDEQGNFTETVLLHEGYNILRLNAKDRFGRKTEKILELVHWPTNLENI